MGNRSLGVETACGLHPLYRSRLPKMHELSTRSGATARRSNTPIALIRKMDWISKTCGCSHCSPSRRFGSDRATHRSGHGSAIWAAHCAQTCGRVSSQERMRRIFVLVLMAALFVYYLNHSWPRAATLWLRNLGGKLGLAADRDGPHVRLAGLRAVFITIATLTFAAQHPFPREGMTCGIRHNLGQAAVG